jgi:hypothetical protein
MKRLFHGIIFLILVPFAAEAHDVNSNPVTWNREVSRIIYQRCAFCHRSGGTAFSLMTYQEAQPWAVAIKEAVLSRRMPPWGAVKGFGDFRNDQGLAQKEMDLISDWVDGGIRRGNNPNVLPEIPKFEQVSVFESPREGIQVSGDFILKHPVIVDGLLPQKVPSGRSLEIIAELPDGAIQPLVWLYQYRDGYQHPFLFKNPLNLPAGTRIRGVPSNARIVLIPKTRSAPK